MLMSSSQVILKEVSVFINPGTYTWVIPASQDFVVQYCKETSQILITEHIRHAPNRQNVETGNTGYDRKEGVSDAEKQTQRQ